MPLRRRRPFGRGPSDGLGELGDIEEEIGLAAQIVRNHWCRGAERRSDGDAFAFALQRRDQRGEVAIAREQHEVVKERRHLEGIDREFFADGNWTTILVVNIGHPGENPWFDRLPRVPEEQAIAFA